MKKTTVPMEERKHSLTTVFAVDGPPSLQMLLSRVHNEEDPVVRLEAEAALHTWAAQDCIRRAERLRAEVNA